MGLTFMLIIVPWTGVPVGIQFAVRFFLLQFKIYLLFHFYRSQKAALVLKVGPKETAYPDTNVYAAPLFRAHHYTITQTLKGLALCLRWFLDLGGLIIQRVVI